MSGNMESKSWDYTPKRDHDFCYRWTISNFSFFIEGRWECIPSPVFSSEANDEVVWRLRVHTDGVDEESKDHLTLYMMLLSCKKSSILASFHFCILNAKGEKSNDSRSPGIYRLRPYQAFGFKNFIHRDFLLSQTNSLLLDDKLTLLCKVRVYKDSLSISGQDTRPAINIPRCTMTDDIKKMWENSLFTDCCLLVGGIEFRAHKAILAARSPVFRARFEHEMKESPTNCIEIHDLDPQVFKKMMDFIYTGKAPHLHSHSMATGVLEAAYKYGLEDLKVMCEDALCRNLTVENAAHTLILADLHSREQLKAQALDFIALYASEVSETSVWKSMVESHPHLVVGAFNSLASAKRAFWSLPLKRLKWSLRPSQLGPTPVSQQQQPELLPTSSG